MNDLKTAEAVRLKLRAAGFPPIPAEGKIPHIKGWQGLGAASAEEIVNWTQEYPSHINTSVLTQFTPACDIDILDQEAAEACELLIRDRFGDTGSLLVRFGLRPKRMMLFQTAKAFKKIAVALIAANGDTRQKIEFMCDGQQVVVDGIHPDTRQPYEWVGGVLGDIKRVDLPCINEAEAKALVRDLVELLIAEHGYKIAPGSAALPVTNGHDDEYEPLIQPRADDWLLLINNILDGASLHDSVRDLAAKLVAGGMKGGATVNLVRGLLAQSRTPRDDRYYDRLHEIPGLVSSAERKFADSEYTEADPPKKIELLSSAAFVASYVPPDFLIDDLLQRQFFYSLTGKTGAGKTAIALMIAVLVALARDLDGRQSERGRVLYLAGENPVDVRQRWIAMSQQMDFDYNTIDVHFIPGVFKVSDMQAEIATQVERLGGVALVIIDTSAAYFEGDDENNNVQAGQYARMQRSLITSLPGGPTILALCHPVKNTTDDNLLPRGGGAYLNETDGNLTAQNDDGVAKLHWQGKFRGPDFAPISFQLRKVTHEMLKDTKGRKITTVVAGHMSDAAEKEFRDVTLGRENEALRIIKENHGNISYSDLAKHAGLMGKDGKPSKSAAFHCVRGLKKEKLVKEGRGKRLEITDAGKKALNGRDED